MHCLRLERTVLYLLNNTPKPSAMYSFILGFGYKNVLLTKYIYFVIHPLKLNKFYKPNNKTHHKIKIKLLQLIN